MFRRYWCVLGLLFLSMTAVADLGYQEALPEVKQAVAAKADNTDTASTNMNDAGQIKAQGADSPQIAMLMDKVIQLNQVNARFQSQVHQQVQTLQAENQALSQKLLQMATVMQTLNQAIGRQSSTSVSGSGGVMTWLVSEEKSMGSSVFFALFALLLVSLFFSAWWIWPKGSSAPTASTESEYDFMGSVEAIPAKLDLARAYVAMGDKPAAEAALKEVLAKGDPKQKKAAEGLLTKLAGDHASRNE